MSSSQNSSKFSQFLFFFKQETTLTSIQIQSNYIDGLTNLLINTFIDDLVELLI